MSDPKEQVAPNWWGWGWGPGHQESAEFSILEAFFSAAFGITKRIREIEHPNCRSNRGNHDGWLLTFIDFTTTEVYP
jgi:hypothetical protein